MLVCVGSIQHESVADEQDDRVVDMLLAGLESIAILPCGVKGRHDPSFDTVPGRECNMRHGRGRTDRVVPVVHRCPSWLFRLEI